MERTLQVFVSFRVSDPEGLLEEKFGLPGPYVPQSEIIPLRKPIRYPGDLEELRNTLRGYVKGEKGIDIRNGSVIIDRWEYLPENE